MPSVYGPIKRSGYRHSGTEVYVSFGIMCVFSIDAFLVTDIAHHLCNDECISGMVTPGDQLLLPGTF
jgi:hypothetical protein